MLGELGSDQMGEIPEAQQSPGRVPRTLLGHLSLPEAGGSPLSKHKDQIHFFVSVSFSGGRVLLWSRDSRLSFMSRPTWHLSQDLREMQMEGPGLLL